MLVWTVTSYSGCLRSAHVSKKAELLCSFVPFFFLFFPTDGSVSPYTTIQRIPLDLGNTVDPPTMQISNLDSHNPVFVCVFVCLFFLRTSRANPVGSRVLLLSIRVHAVSPPARSFLIAHYGSARTLAARRLSLDFAYTAHALSHAFRDKTKQKNKHTTK